MGWRRESWGAVHACCSVLLGQANARIDARTKRARAGMDDGEEWVRRTWEVTKFQAEYLRTLVEKRRLDEHMVGAGLNGASWMVQRLIIQANKETKKMKHFIFRIIRCENCTQSSTGGKKVQVDLSLRAEHLQWMENVHRACEHASVDKTLRILLDFYISQAQKNEALESKWFSPPVLTIAPTPPPSRRVVLVALLAIAAAAAHACRRT